MSQILDALKRAEAQRQGQASWQAGTQSPAAELPASTTAPATGPRWWVVALVLVAVVAALGAWYALGPSLTVTATAPPSSLSPAGS